MLRTVDKVGLSIISICLLVSAYLIVVWGNMVHPNMWSVSSEGAMGVLVVFLVVSLGLTGLTLAKNVWENNQVVNISVKDAFNAIYNK